MTPDELRESMARRKRARNVVREVRRMARAEGLAERDDSAATTLRGRERAVLREVAELDGFDRATLRGLRAARGAR